MSDLFPEYEHENRARRLLDTIRTYIETLGFSTGPPPGRGLGHRVIESMLEIDSVLLSTPSVHPLFHQDWILTRFVFAPASGTSMRLQQHSPLGQREHSAQKQQSRPRRPSLQPLPPQVQEKRYSRSSTTRTPTSSRSSSQPCGPSSRPADYALSPRTRPTAWRNRCPRAPNYSR